MSVPVPTTQATQPRRARRIALIVCAWLGAGVFISMLVAWSLVLSSPDLRVTRSLSATGDEDEQMTASLSEGFGSTQIVLTRDFGQAWAPMRAVGQPDTPAMGDNTTAWASLTPDGQKEWLELTYAKPTLPKEAWVYETLSPGAVSSVTSVDANGNETELWAGQDPATQNASGVYVAKIPLRGSASVSCIRLYIDSPRVQGWNEMDAVGLVGQDGSMQWAKSARASSTYASVSRGATTYSRQQLIAALPDWVPILPFTDPSVSQSDSRRIEARGWPMRALWGEVQNSFPVMMSSGSRRVLVISRPPAAGPVPAAHVWPYRPIWLGLLADGALYAAILLVLYLSTFRLRRILRESSRLRHGCCIRCGYDLRYDFVHGCSECGWNRFFESSRFVQRSNKKECTG
jgi:hypothetical protein